MSPLERWVRLDLNFGGVRKFTLPTPYFSYADAGRIRISNAPWPIGDKQNGR